MPPSDGDKRKLAETKPRQRVHRRPNGKLTVERVIEALRVSAGIRAIAAEKLQVHRSAITRFIQNNPEIEDVEAEIVEELADVAEAKLLEGIKRGDFPNVKFYLENKARNRGYGRNLELTGAKGQAIAVTAQPAMDYSKLTVAELRQLEAIMAKAAPTPLALEGGGATDVGGAPHDRSDGD
jgi:hypothetical protein